MFFLRATWICSLLAFQNAIARTYIGNKKWVSQITKIHYDGPVETPLCCRHPPSPSWHQSSVPRTPMFFLTKLEFARYWLSSALSIVPILATETEFHKPRKLIMTALLRPRCDVTPPPSCVPQTQMLVFWGQNLNVLVTGFLTRYRSCLYWQQKQNFKNHDNKLRRPCWDPAVTSFPPPPFLLCPQIQVLFFEGKTWLCSLLAF